MAAPFQFGESVTIHPTSSQAEDAHGNPVSGFGSPVTYAGCAVAPSSSDEPDVAGRTPVVTALTVYGPLGMVVGAHDEATYRGQRYRVIGEVGDPVNPFTGRRPGPFFRMEKVSG